MEIKDLTELADRIDAYIGAQTDLENLNQVSEWVFEVEAEFARLAQYSAFAETMFAQRMVQVIQNATPEIWARIKNSSTIQERYVAGLHPAEYEILRRLQNLQVVVKTTFDNLRTLIVTKRDSDNGFKSSQVNNTNQRREPMPNFER